MSPRPRVLVVDDEGCGLQSLERINEEDFEVRAAMKGGAAERVPGSERVPMALGDQRVSRMTGVEVLERVQPRSPDGVRGILYGRTDARKIISGIDEAGIRPVVTRPRQPEGLNRGSWQAARLHELQRHAELLAIELAPSVERAETLVGSLRGGLRPGRRRDAPASSWTRQRGCRCPPGEGATEPVAVQHLLRSFDAGMVCAVH